MNTAITQMIMFLIIHCMSCVTSDSTCLATLRGRRPSVSPVCSISSMDAPTDHISHMLR